jgi:hypothetical protein
MSERKTDKQEKEWSDEIPIPEDDEFRPEPYEETYRDGSARNECAPPDDR